MTATKAATGRLYPEKSFAFVAILVTMYIVSLIAGVFYTQMMAIITQGSLQKLREKMFSHMQDLPMRYFDTNGHGDIMSYYTNDVDTLRQMISQSLPQMTISAVHASDDLLHHDVLQHHSGRHRRRSALSCMVFAAKAITARSSKYFLRQQITIAKAEAFMEEMMTGQKVIKVFCHEEAAKADFDKVNGEIFYNARNGNRFANILMPLLGNVGNVMYVVVAVVGGALLLTDVPNFSISGMAFSISIVVPFLNMTKQFAGAIGQVSNQINMVIMGLAGAHRIFALLRRGAGDGRGLCHAGKRQGESPTGRSPSARNAPISGHGSTRTTTAHSPTPACAATCVFMTWTSDIRRRRRFCTTSPFMPSRARRSLSSAPPAQERRRLPI